MNIKELILKEFINIITEAIDKFVNVLPTDDEEKSEILTYFNKFKDVKVNWHEKNKEKLLNDLREIMAKNLSKTQLKKQVKELGVGGIPTDEYIEGKEFKGFKVYIPLTFRASRMLGSLDIGSQLGKWCTTTKKGYWDSYKEQKKINVIFINIDTGVKYIIAVKDDKVVEFADNTNNHNANHPFDLDNSINFNKEYIDKAGDILLEDIRNERLFIDYVEEGDVEGIKKMMKKGVDPSAKDNSAIQRASYYGHLEIVKLLLKDSRVDPSAKDNSAIQQASYYGHLEIVKLLLADKRVDPSARNNYAIRWASDSGHLEVVKLLLKDSRVNPSDDNNYAIRYASRNGHIEVVKFLLQDSRVDPSDINNSAIVWASDSGHLEVVKLLLQDKRVNPTTNINSAIRHASASGRIEVVKLLLQDKRVKKSLSREDIEKYEKQIGK